MFKPFLLFSFGLFSLTAQAQTTPPAAALPAPISQELSAGKRDTIDAIGRLFGKRRLGGKIWLGAAAGGGLTVLRAIANPNTTTTNGVRTSTEVNGSGIATVAAIFMGVPLAVGIGKLSSFSLAKQNEIVSAYRNGQPLPRRVARKLLKGYFR